jgi:hypothetical protein
VTTQDVGVRVVFPKSRTPALEWCTKRPQASGIRTRQTPGVALAINGSSFSTTSGETVERRFLRSVRLRSAPCQMLIPQWLP